MDKVTRMAILTKIEELQKRDKDELGGCSPIELSIGTVSDTNMVEHNTILITKACPKVVQELVNMCGYRADISKGGLLIWCDKDN